MSDLDGTVEHCVLSLRGSGNFDALPLKSNNLEVALSGSGNIFCTAINSAQVQLSGSGNVKVYGKPIHKSQNRTGSGNISFK
ncbi:GIN domain-containing protein [Acinetobacter pittii]|uniref:GIN domain-containing protein n=1 Tax=Acinetobacter pittii TaxID=48296 RepID=UPI00313E8C1A